MKDDLEKRIPRVGILGGTFNPVHFAHLRLAACVAEALNLERVELMPCAVPPHKPGAGLLPFALRCDLLEAAIKGQPRFCVNRLEEELSPPSYTWNLIEAWKERHAGEVPLFILGAEDFAQVENWHRGSELALATSLLAVPRGRADEAAFRQVLDRLSPGAEIVALHQAALEPAESARKQAPEAEKGLCDESTKLLAAPLSERTICLFLPLPLLDISASAVRVKWMRGDTIRFLTPDPVIALIEAHAEEIRSCWNVFA